MWVVIRPGSSAPARRVRILRRQRRHAVSAAAPQTSTEWLRAAGRAPVRGRSTVARQTGEPLDRGRHLELDAVVECFRLRNWEKLVGPFRGVGELVEELWRKLQLKPAGSSPEQGLSA